MAVCGKSLQDNIVLTFCLLSFLKSFSTNAIKENMCRSFFQSVTKRAKGSV